jgi:hypothetical protein
VLKDTVYVLPSTAPENAGKRVGYLAYRKFYSAAEDENDTDLIDAFRRFKQAGVDELVLDLRFNSGGLSTLFVRLSSLIAPAEKVAGNEVLTYWAGRVNAQLPSGSDGFRLKPDESTTANLDLDRLYVLANQFTASASELTVHCLRRHMTVIHYGEKTVGKYFGSNSISGESDGVPWIMHPITRRYFDNRSMDDPGYPGGLIPQVELKITPQGLGDLGEWNPEKPYDSDLLRVMNDLQGIAPAADTRVDTRSVSSWRVVSTPKAEMIIADGR